MKTRTLIGLSLSVAFLPAIANATALATAVKMIGAKDDVVRVQTEVKNFVAAANEKTNPPMSNETRAQILRSKIWGAQQAVLQLKKAPVMNTFFIGDVLSEKMDKEVSPKLREVSNQLRSGTPEAIRSATKQAEDALAQINALVAE